MVTVHTLADRLLVGALAAAILTVAALTRTLEIRRLHPQIYRTAETALYVSVLLALGVGLTDWGAKATLGSLVGLLVWLTRTPANSG